jgi:hypothetical protein
MRKPGMRSGALTSAAVALLTLGVAGPAFAQAASGGAEVHRFANVCQLDIETGVTFCVNGQVVTNEVQRPNGTGGYVTNGTVMITGSDGSFYSETVHGQDVFTSTGERESHSFFASFTSTPDGQTCTTTMRFLYAGAQTRIDSISDTCVQSGI